jgi:hypothetical protein
VLNLTCVTADLDDRFADVVIGSDTIAKEGLLNSKWIIRTSLETSTTDNTLENTETENVAAQHGEQPIDSGPTWLTGEESVILGGLLGENYMSKEEVWGPQDPEPDGNENIETISDLLPDRARGGGDDDLPKVTGSGRIPEAVLSLCRRFRHIFSRTVQSKPSKIPKFKLSVAKDSVWHEAASKEGARPQPQDRNSEIKRQLDLMLSLGVIEQAQDIGYFSQVLLTPKPNGK